MLCSDILTKFGSHRAFVRQIDPFMTYDPRWGRFENYDKPRGPVPHANFQLDTSKHDVTYSRTTTCMKKRQHIGITQNDP